MNKQIIITNSFRRRLRRLRRHFSEKSIIDDVRRFSSSGFGKGECELKKEIINDVVISIVKLRIRVQDAIGRYLIGVINEREYIPIFIDLKTGRYGRNMRFSASREVASMLERAFEEVLSDYLEHTEEEPKLTRYPG